MTTRRRREDGAQMRRRIVEAAGVVFAEKGLALATGKEIAARAGTNSAAVNYYFGGVASLYQEVLLEAHDRLITLDRLSEVSRLPIAAQQKIDLILNGLLSTLLGDEGAHWMVKVLVREVLTPSPAMLILKERGILPKQKIVSAIVSDYLSLPEDDPRTVAVTIGMVGPFLLLLIGEKSILPTVFPQIFSGDRPRADIAATLRTFLFGGLDAVAAGAAVAEPVAADIKPHRGH